MKRLPVLILMLVVLAGCSPGKMNVPVTFDLRPELLHTRSLHRGKSATVSATAKPQNPAQEITFTFTATGSVAIEGESDFWLDRLRARQKGRATAEVQAVGLGRGEVKACAQLYDTKDAQQYLRCTAFAYYVTPEAVYYSPNGSTYNLVLSYLKRLHRQGKLTDREYELEVRKFHQGVPSPNRP